MQITVFGASGKVGRLIVDQLLVEGHKVVAFVHGDSNLNPNKKLKIINGDIRIKKDIDKAVKDSQIVISALGSWHTKNKDILATAMKNIVPAMEKQNIKRLISLTGSDARWSQDIPTVTNKLLRPFLKLTAGKILYDGEEHIRILEKSNLDWTVVRSPVMKSTGKLGEYKLNMIAPYPWETVYRNNVSKAIYSQIKDTTYINSCPHIH